VKEITISIEDVGFSLTSNEAVQIGMLIQALRRSLLHPFLG
jgi:hypothetical protein